MFQIQQNDLHIVVIAEQRKLKLPFILNFHATTHDRQTIIKLTFGYYINCYRFKN